MRQIGEHVFCKKSGNPQSTEGGGTEDSIPSSMLMLFTQHTKEEHSTPHSKEIYDEESGQVEAQELQQGISEVENFSEVPAQTEQGIPDAESDQNSRDVGLNEQHVTRKPYQNYRGGRGSRGGRGNSRGGGYQNGRSQYYDQPGGYYPRNNYNYRGQGGRGMGSNYSYNGPAGHAQATL